MTAFTNNNILLVIKLVCYLQSKKRALYKLFKYTFAMSTMFAVNIYLRL